MGNMSSRSSQRKPLEEGSRVTVDLYPLGVRQDPGKDYCSCTVTQVIDANTVKIQLGLSEKERIVDTKFVWHAPDKAWLKYLKRGLVLPEAESDSDNSSDNSDEDAGRHNRGDAVDEELKRAHEAIQAMRRDLENRGTVSEHGSSECPLYDEMRLLTAVSNPKMQEACQIHYGNLIKKFIVLGEAGSGKTTCLKKAMSEMLDCPRIYPAAVLVTPNMVGPGKHHGDGQRKVEDLKNLVERLANATAPNDADGNPRHVLVVVMWDEFASSIMPSDHSDSAESGFCASLRQWLDDLPDNVILLGTSCKNDFWNLDWQERRRLYAVYMPDQTPESIHHFVSSIAEANKLLLDVTHKQLAALAKRLYNNNTPLWEIIQMVKKLKLTHNMKFILEFRHQTGTLPRNSQRIDHQTLAAAVHALLSPPPRVGTKRE